MQLNTCFLLQGYRVLVSKCASACTNHADMTASAAMARSAQPKREQVSAEMSVDHPCCQSCFLVVAIPTHTLRLLLLVCPCFSASYMYYLYTASLLSSTFLSHEHVCGLRLTGTSDGVGACHSLQQREPEACRRAAACGQEDHRHCG